MMDYIYLKKKINSDSIHIPQTSFILIINNTFY